jgi:hypothetical protein
MRNQTLVDTVVIPGHFSSHPGAIASISVINDSNLEHLQYADEETAGKELAEFLLEVIPAGVLNEAFHRIASKVEMVEELGDIFDELAFEKLATSIDPGLNALFVDKCNQWNGGVGSTAISLEFIQKAITYAKTGHVDMPDIT